MKARYPVFLLIFFCSCFIAVYAENLFFASIMPNTDDDANLEYIELVNRGSDVLALSGYVIKDKSEKAYSFGQEDSLAPGESKRFYRTQTKIILNNTDEELYLFDPAGNRSDSFVYSSSLKNTPIVISNISDDTLPLPPTEETGGISSGSVSLPDTASTGVVILPDPGITGSGIEVGPPLEALRLFYSDSDSNGKIDLLEIEFSDNMTGALSAGSLRIYSSTGGLSSAKIDTSTGLISSFSMSGNILFVHLIEQDLIKPELSVNNTTSSELRLKSYSGIGIRDSGGVEMKPITFTDSFDGYKDVFLKRSFEQSNTGSTSGSGSDQSTGGIVTDLAIIPDILIDLQMPSYLVPYSSGNYRCDDEHPECKANFNIERSFSGSAEKNRFGCRVRFGSGDIIQTCNPGTAVFSSGVTYVVFRIYEKLRPDNFRESSFSVINIPEKLTIPDPIIIIQSGLDSNLHCNKPECSVNFDGGSVIMDNSSRFQCSWDFGGGVFSEGSEDKCNPSYIRYGRGGHMIKLKIYERGNEGNSKETALMIYNDFIPSHTSATNDVPLPQNLFRIKLQGATGSKNRKLEGNKLHVTSQSGCSVNLDVENPSDVKGNRYRYLWDFGNGVRSEKRNPPSLIYLSGSYIIHLIGTDENGSVKEDYFHVTCSIQTKAEAPKKEEQAIDDDVLTAKEFKEFSKLFTEILRDTQDEMDFEKVLEKLLLRTQKEMDHISNLGFTLQGKKSKNINLISDRIFCRTKKTCSINLGLQEKKLAGFDYFWNMGNGAVFTGSNPKAVAYPPGRYLATLEVKDENDASVIRKQLYITVSKIMPKKKVKKPKKPKKPKTLTISAKPYKEIPPKYQSLLEREDIIASLLVILSLTGGILYFSRRKDDIMRQD